MAEGTVDNLNIQLSADADQAAKSLNNLVTTLRSINTAFAKDISRMRKFSKEIGTLSASMRSLAKIKFSAPDMSGMNKMLKSLNGMDASGAKKTADGIEKVVNSFNKLGNAKFNDSGINKTVNALNRLFKVDMSKFNPNDFVRITDSIAKLGTIPDVSSGVNRFVSSLSRLANAGEKTGQSASSILKLGEQTKLVAKQLQSVGAINDDVNLFVQSIGRLASAGSKTRQTASGLSTLAKETIEFFKAMQNAPKVSENTIRMTQALAQLASAGGKVGTATNTVTSSFNKLASVGNKTLSAMKKVSSGIVSAFKNIGNSSGNLTKAQFSLSNLLKTAIGFRLGYGLLNFGKQAFQLGSDITEVENVVDVAFGNMADKAYEFAQTAQERFGLSELSALKYSGTMMAILNSSGVDQSAAAEMSTTLTGLAGDLASFYNIAQDDAWTKIMSAMAGEVEPMRRLGVSMTVANMEAYALSQGITKSWQSMTQAEQAMLRYNYMMDATAQQQGDFARTSWSWANQVRLLTLNIQQLASTIGQGLISAVLPAVTALNKLFTVLQKAAVAVRNFFYVLTGYKGGGSSGIVTDISTAMDDIADSSGAATGGISDAADAAEDLKDQLTLLPFDEINKLSDVSVGDNGSGGSGGGAGGVGGGDLGLDDGLLGLGDKDPEKYVSPWAERIRKAFLAEDWEGLGAEIADGLNKGLQKVYDVINWSNVGPKITAFTTAFTETFNSFANAFDFDLLGRTIGTGINTIVNTLNQLIDGIDWIALGERFAHGFNGLADEIDWFELGRLIGNKFMIAWDTLLGFVTTLDWGEVGRSLADGFNGMLKEVSLGDIGTTIGTIVAGVIEMFREFFSNADWGEVSDQIKDGLSKAIKAASDDGRNDGILAGIIGVGAVAGIGKAFLDVVPILSDLKELFGGKEKDKNGIFSGIGDGVKEKMGGLTDVFKNGSSKISEYLDDIALNASIAFEATGSSSSGLLSRVSSAFGNFFGKLSGLSTGATFGLIAGGLALIVGGIVDLWKTSESFRNSVSDVFDGISDSFDYFKKKVWDDGLKPLWDRIGEFFSSLYELYESSGMKKAFEEIATFIIEVIGTNLSVAIETMANSFGTVTNVIGDVLEILTGVIEFVTGVFSGDWDKAWGGVEKIVDGFVEGVSDLFSGLWKNIETIFSPVVKFFEDKFGNAKKGVENIWKDVSGWFGKKWDGIKQTFTNAPSSFKTWFGNAYSNVQGAWKSVNTWFGDRWSGIKETFSPASETFRGWFSNAYTGVQGIWSNVNGWFQGKWSSVQGVFSNVVSFFSNGFRNAYNAVTNIWSGISGFFRNIANGILSPIESAVNGIISGINWVLGKVGSRTRLSSWSAPRFAKGSDGIKEDTFGIVNDQKGSTYKELIVPPSGKAFIPKGRNVMLPLEKGTKIMPAKQTKEFMKSMNVPRFANGIGDILGGAWSKVKDFAGDVWDFMTNPGKLVQIAINKFVSLANVFEPWLSVIGGIANTLLGSITDFIGKIFDETGGHGVESAVKWALKIAGDNSHGYDQASRWGHPDYDCSSLTISAFQQAGIPLKSAGASYTGNIYSAAKSIGFKDVTRSVNRNTSSGMKRGDILLKRGNHAAIYTGNRRLVQASANEFGRATGGKPGDQTGREISARTYYNYPWSDVLRFAGNFKEGIGKILPSDISWNIPFLQDGGLIRYPTLAMTGERNRKEAVLPLENRRTMSMIADSIFDNADGAIGLSKEELRDAVAQGVAMAMMSGQSNQSITVYAELKTENDEVLARAVTRGQKKLDYRFNPIPQTG